ncbi:MAG: transporter substrate-binding domain-containing protein [Rhizobiaceae bacterium]|nr:transporter substrate-binding domain-containing protein [Rhizobiaceae bacterium]
MLVVRDPSTGLLRGKGVTLAKELARRLDLSLDMVSFGTAGEILRALGQDLWDVAFLAIDPARAANLDFTAPYMTIEGTYLVATASTFRTVGDVDRRGVRIAVSQGSAIDQHLTKLVRNAELVRAQGDTGATSLTLFRELGLDALAGGRQQLAGYAEGNPELRVLSDHFLLVQQAMCLPKGRAEAADFLRDFVEEMKDD